MSEHGITGDTAERILLGPGAVYIGDPDTGTLLGATKGGNEFVVERTIKDLEPDGALGKVKGLRLRERVEARLTVRLIEVTEDIIEKAIAGGNLASHIITGGAIATTDYIDEVSIKATISGVTEGDEADGVICTLQNCLVEGPLTIALPERNETVVELVFHAHFDPDDMDTEPWSIEFIPVEAS